MCTLFWREAVRLECGRSTAEADVCTAEANDTTKTEVRSLDAKSQERDR